MADGPSSSALKNMKDTSDWFNPTNQRLLNTVSIMTTSSDYRTLSGINTPHIPYPFILHPPAHEDGTDRLFRNVGY